MRCLDAEIFIWLLSSVSMPSLDWNYWPKPCHVNNVGETIVLLTNEFAAILSLTAYFWRPLSISWWALILCTVCAHTYRSAQKLRIRNVPSTNVGHHDLVLTQTRSCPCSPLYLFWPRTLLVRGEPYYFRSEQTLTDKRPDSWGSLWLDRCYMTTKSKRREG